MEPAIESHKDELKRIFLKSRELSFSHFPRRKEKPKIECVVDVFNDNIEVVD